MSVKKSCAFFGHRTLESDLTRHLEKAINTMIQEYRITTFWCGGYGAFDKKAARAVYQIREEQPEIELVLVRAYLPKPGEELSDIYDGSIYPEGLETVPKRFAISRRNQWMAKNCDTAITYVNHTYGGAYTAASMLEKRQITVCKLGKL